MCLLQSACEENPVSSQICVMKHVHLYCHLLQVPVRRDGNKTTTNSHSHLETTSLFASLSPQPFSLYIWLSVVLEITRASCEGALRYNLWNIFKGGESFDFLAEWTQSCIFNGAHLCGERVCEERGGGKENQRQITKCFCILASVTFTFAWLYRQMTRWAAGAASTVST